VGRIEKAGGGRTGSGREKEEVLIPALRPFLSHIPLVAGPRFPAIVPIDRDPGTRVILNENQNIQESKFSI